jgi:hypothetical protein
MSYLLRRNKEWPNIKEIGCELQSNSPEYGPLLWTPNEPLGSIKGGYFLDQLSHCHLLKQDSALSKHRTHETECLVPGKNVTDRKADMGGPISYSALTLEREEQRRRLCLSRYEKNIAWGYLRTWCWEECLDQDGWSDKRLHKENTTRLHYKDQLVNAVLGK